MPASQYLPRSRAERAVAGARVVLALFSVLALWLDPSEPPEYAQITWILVLSYVPYALLLAWPAWTAPDSGGRFALTTHIADLVIFSVLLALTRGPASPFFVFFVFSLLAGAVRWHTNGTLWTGVGCLAVYVGLGAYAEGVPGDPSFELNRFILRIIYLGVVTFFLAYLARHEERSRQEIQKLAAWPRALSGDIVVLLGEMLGHAASILGSARVALVWEEREEPWRHIAEWAVTGLTLKRERPEMFEPLVDPSLTAASILCTDAAGAEPVALIRGEAGLRVWRGRPINQALVDALSIRAVIVLRIDGEATEGRVLFLDPRSMTADDLLLGEIVAHELAASLDHYYLGARLRHVAVAEERIRLARDLHDGVLQSLTGARLQLQAVALDVDRDPARDRLLAIERAIAVEQADLRSFIDDLKPLATHEMTGAPLVDRLRRLQDRMERQWSLPVSLSVEPQEFDVPPAVAHQVYLMIHEALVNVARHARASHAQVELRGSDSGLRIRIADDGRGFPFKGRRSAAELDIDGIGPISLRERVWSLGGQLAVESSERGAIVELRVPLVREA